MTHDLLTSVLEASGSGIASIEVRLMDSSTYAGTIRLNNGSEYDARASDSIAVAVRSQCQVTMRQETLQAVSVTPRYHDQGDDADSTSPGVSPEAQTVPRQGPISEDEIREFEKFLSEAEPEDFDRQ